MAVSRQEFISLILKGKAITRIYYFNKSNKILKKIISDKLYQDDELTLTKPPKKRFYGNFTDLDTFSARIKPSIWRYANTIYRYIELKGTISQDPKNVELIVDYFPTKHIKELIIAIGLVAILVALLVILTNPNFGALIVSVGFFILVFGISVISVISGINNNIKYCEDYLFEFDDKTTGNKM